MTELDQSEGSVEKKENGCPETERKIFRKEKAHEPFNLMNGWIRLTVSITPPVTPKMTPAPV